MTILAVAVSIFLFVGSLALAHWIDRWKRRQHEGKWP